MRTVLATDELLARAVAKKSIGDVVTVDHQEMRDLGYQGSLRRVRELVIELRSVLVIGGRSWDDPVPFLRDLRLQPFVPVILLLAAGQKPPAMLEWRPRIYAIIPTEGGAQIGSTIAEQCRDAWWFVHQRLKPAKTLLVVRDEPRRGPLPETTRVLTPDQWGAEASE